jgi:glutathione S-transferase
MKLYDWSIAPNPRRVRIYLREKAIDIPIEEAGYPDKPILKPDYLAAHPHRRVPLLVLDDGTEISEAMAICRYFETLYPEPALMGGDARERGIVEMWERMAEWEGMVAVSEVFRNSKRSFADRGVAGSADPMPQIPALVERGMQRVGLFFDKFNTQLAHNEFVAGDKFSVADITTLCVIDFAILVGLEIPETCPHVARWHAAASARPSARG